MRLGLVYLDGYRGIPEDAFCSFGAALSARVECMGDFDIIRKSLRLCYDACDGVVSVYTGATWHFLQKSMLMEFGRSGVYSDVMGKPRVVAAGFVHIGGGTFFGEVDGKPFVFIDGDARNVDMSVLSSAVQGDMACVGVFAERVDAPQYRVSSDEVGSWIICPRSHIPRLPVKDRANIYTTIGESEGRVLFNLLREKGLTLSVAESCTGGMMAKTITDIPGSSEVFVGGFVVYSNSLKERSLGVYPEDLKRYGAVSEEVARQMVLGAIQRSGSNCAVCTTGIAGPTGGTDKKPVGLVYIGAAMKGEVIVKRMEFSGNRFTVRSKSTRYAFLLLRSLILRMA